MMKEVPSCHSKLEVELELLGTRPGLDGWTTADGQVGV